MSRATSRKIIVVCVVLDDAVTAAGATAVVRTGGIVEEAGFVGRGGTGALLVFGVVLVVVAAVEAGVVIDCCCCINGTAAAAAAAEEEDSEAEGEGIAAPERVPTAQRRRGFVVFPSASASRVWTATVFVPLGCSSPSKATSSKTVLYWIAATHTAGPAWSGPGANA